METVFRTNTDNEGMGILIISSLIFPEKRRGVGGRVGWWGGCVCVCVGGGGVVLITHTSMRFMDR